MGRRDKWRGRQRKVTKKDGGVDSCPAEVPPHGGWGRGSRNGFHGDSWFLVAWHVGY